MFVPWLVQGQYRAGCLFGSVRFQGIKPINRGIVYFEAIVE